MARTVMPRNGPRALRTHGLPGRLRAETADLHRGVEAVADVTGRVRSVADYVDFLQRMHQVHAGLEDRLANPVWAPQWAGVGVRIARHRRASALAGDLAALGVGVRTDTLTAPVLESFGHALGCLYVLEGSALGGPTVAGLVRAALGDVPAAFLTGTGRAHPGLWPAVRHGLRRFEVQGGDGDAVVAGARLTFGAFAVHLTGRLSAR